jgi:hypothetical protein
MPRATHRGLAAVVAALAALAAALVAASPAAHAAEAGSAAVSTQMLDELGEEIERGLSRLAVPGEPRPYFIAYKLTEVEVNNVAAILGSTSAVDERHFMGLDAHVRVGDYQFDNSNFVLPRQDGTDGSATIPLALEATPTIARKAAWLATDAAYKEALEQLTAKRSAVRRSASPSYSKEPPLVMMEKLDIPALESRDQLEKLASEVSGVFRDQAHVRDSRVSYTSFVERRWYLNSEGTRAHDVRRVTGVVIVATARAKDGEIVSLYTSHYGRTMEDLPGAEELRKQALAIAKQLDGLRNAEPIDAYTGPVLFEDEGAAGIVRYTLTDHLGGTPLPEGIAPKDAEREFGGAFAGRIGQRVVSPVLSVIDDPTTSRAGKRALIGGYKFDDEGVKSQRVQVIDAGKLDTLLIGRMPSTQIKQSNGHARRQGPGGFHGTTTNLFVTAKSGQGRKQLRRALIKEAAAQGLPYGIVVKSFDDSAVTANAEMSRLELIAALNAMDLDAPPPVLLAYRVYPDGREEPVRGVQFRPVPVRAWRDVMAAGKDTIAFNYLASSEDATLQRVRGGAEGYVPSLGVESAIVTPDLLFKELDIGRAEVQRVPEPAVPRP